MRRVDLHRIEPRLARPHRRVAERPDRQRDLVSGRLFRRIGVFLERVAHPRGPQRRPADRRDGGAGTRVGQLQARHGPLAPDGGGQTRQPRDQPVLVHTHLRVAEATPRVHVRVFNDDERGARRRAQAMVFDDAIGHLAARRREPGEHRRHHDAVAQDEACDGQRRQQGVHGADASTREHLTGCVGQPLRARPSFASRSSRPMSPAGPRLPARSSSGCRTDRHTRTCCWRPSPRRSWRATP